MKFSGGFFVIVMDSLWVTSQMFVMKWDLKMLNNGCFKEEEGHCWFSGLGNCHHLSVSAILCVTIAGGRGEYF